MLTLQKLKDMKPGIFATGIAEIEHPWFNNAKPVSEGGSLTHGHLTEVKWVAVRGGIHDWAIYHSLDANLELARYLDGLSHLERSWEDIYEMGAKLHDEKLAQQLLEADDEAMEMYRH
jgi:hypothetical protein